MFWTIQSMAVPFAWQRYLGNGPGPCTQQENRVERGIEGPVCFESRRLGFWACQLNYPPRHLSNQNCSKSHTPVFFLPLGASARNRLDLGAGRRGRGEVASPSLRVLGEGGEPSPGGGGRRGGAGVLSGSTVVVNGWLWIMELWK